MKKVIFPTPSIEMENHFMLFSRRGVFSPSSRGWQAAFFYGGNDCFI
jgi:hypothetical protein